MRRDRYGSGRLFFVTLSIALWLVVGRLDAEDFHYPLKPAAAEHGPVYVADLRLPGILVVKDGKVETYFAASKKLGTPLCRVRSLAIDRDGKVLAGDSATREVYRFDQPGKPTPLIKGAQAGIGIPMAIAVDSKGNIYTGEVDTGKRLQKFKPVL